MGNPLKHVPLVAALSTLAGGCDEPAYFAGAEVLELLGTEEGMEHPAVGSFVQSEYWLDFRPPSDAQLEQLQPAGANPSAMEPWVERSDLSVSIQWTLTNNSEARARAFVLLDGATEFFDYNPIGDYGGGEIVLEEEPVYPSLLGFSPLELDGGEVLRGEFRTDDILEAMFDLDVMTRFCGGPYALLYNRHERDPAGTTMLPDDATLAGMVMFRITLASNVQASLQYAIRVEDSAGVLFDSRTDGTRYEPTPEAFAPAIMQATGENTTCVVGSAG